MFNNWITYPNRCSDKASKQSGHHRASQGIGDEKRDVNFAARKREMIWKMERTIKKSALSDKLLKRKRGYKTASS